MANEQENWAVVELMGHVRLAGRLTEEEKFGSKMGRLDIPIDGGCTGISATFCPIHGTCTCIDREDLNDEKCPLHGNSDHGEVQEGGFITQYFGGGSVYRITFVTEAVARHVAKQTAPAPVSAWDFPKQLAGRGPDTDREQDDNGF